MQRLRSLLVFSIATVLASTGRPAQAQGLKDAEWIWSPQFKQGAATTEAVFFRKRFELAKPASAKIEITCDNIYTLYVNGQKLVEDSHWESVDHHDLSKLLVDGPNVIAVRGLNEGAGSAALIAHITVKSQDGKMTSISTDASWKSTLKAPKGFESPDFDDRDWEGAKSFGKLGEAQPWAGKHKEHSGRLADRFTPQPGFKVEEVIVPGSAGSIVAMAFDEDGSIIASREAGPLLSVRDADGDGQFESITTYCDKVKNCQGILPLDGVVYAVGDGPDGTAFYRLSKSAGSNEANEVTSLFKFRGGMAEHGPHQPVLGPDGFIYLIIGNHAGVQRDFDASSPHHHFYDGELIEPKYEDANGHAAGIKAPGGTVIRTDREGKTMELFVGGFRNAYDIAFNRDGELFTYDSDMEWDVNLPWYRPTRVNHLIPGAEFGWRSGWSKWPEYFVDSLPSTHDTGRGSPTGIEFYEHTRYPEKYHGALLMCDWSLGRVLAVFLKPNGASYQAESEVFLAGRPLNCSDVAVGPDGCAYISVGGRGTQGSILRVAPIDEPGSGRPPVPTKPLDRMIQLARQPQLSAAWSRKQIVEAKQQLGEQFGKGLLAIARNADAPAADRVQALTLLQVYGPQPPVNVLVDLTQDKHSEVRGRAIYLLGLHGNDDTYDTLVAALSDQDGTVRRLACEALVRSGRSAPLEKLLPLLASSDRFASWAARRALEKLPTAEWQRVVLQIDDANVFSQGATSLLVLDPDRETVAAVLDRCGHWLSSGSVSADHAQQLLRIVELGLYRARLQGSDVPDLRAAISKMYPTSDWRVNRELVRVLVYLQDLALAPRLVQQLGSEIPLQEKIHIAMHARFLAVGWTPELQTELLGFIEYASGLEGGNSYRGYLTNAARDLIKSQPMQVQVERIASGAKTPRFTLSLVQALPREPSGEEFTALRKLDQSNAGAGSRAALELSKAVLVALAKSDASGRAYLLEVFETSPDRRGDVALAIANQVGPKSLTEAEWNVLVRSLTAIDGPAARSVLQTLRKSPHKSTDAVALRQVILQGLRLEDQGARDAAALLVQWTGVKQTGSPTETTLAAWQDWFRQSYPDAPDPSLPVDSASNKYTMAQLTEFLSSDAAERGDRERGAAVFEKALCIKCHRYGNRGEGIGPDLTNVSSRFQRKEVLESVLFPSQIISDQFAAKNVLTTDGKTYTGLVGPAGDGIVVLQASAEKVTIPNSEVEMIVPAKKSAMPEGLFSPLTLEEISDLFAYLAKPPAAN